jgi:hypothetical protein
MAHERQEGNLPAQAEPNMRAPTNRHCDDRFLRSEAIYPHRQFLASLMFLQISQISADFQLSLYGKLVPQIPSLAGDF